MAYPFNDDSFDIYGLSERNRLNQLMQDPYSRQLTTPGLMDPGFSRQDIPGMTQPGNDPGFSKLFPPDYHQSPQQPAVQQPDIPHEVMNQPNLMDEYIRLMKEMYHPDTTASDRLNQLLGNFPQEQRPGIGRTIVSALAGLHAGMQPGGNGFKASQDVLDEPFKGDLEKWKAQTGPAYQAAEVERQRNDAERTLTSNVISAKVAADKLMASERQNKEKLDAQEKIKAREAEIAQKKNQLVEMKQNGATFQVKNGHLIATYLDGTEYDTGENLTDYDKLTQIALLGKNQMNVQGLRNQGTANVAGIQNTGKEAVATTQGQTARDVAGLRQAAIGEITDPKDPTKKIGVWYNPATNKMERVTLDDQQVGPLTKPGTPPKDGGNQWTNATKVMSEGSADLLKGVPRLKEMANELEKRGLFGPVMSRVREIAAKVGTTGSPENIEKSFNDLATNISNDPIINQNSDFLVGRFASALSLMASGAGRVHGGARGGGSIQMVNYMKGLLTSDSTLSMFMGRLKGLEDQLTDYAVGPGGAVIKPPKDKLDNILDGILGGQK